MATSLESFDALPEDDARAAVHPVCASEQWLTTVAARRPYPTLDALLAESDSAVAALDAAGVGQALAAHPRIGERADGTDTESAWSRQEQAGTASADEDVARALRDGNVAYEQRFGQVFLICATGRTSRQMLEALDERLGNDDATELDVVRRELAAIARLRLIKLFSS